MKMEEIQNLTFTNILQKALDSVSSKVDKRQGSIIYDTLAAISYVIAGDLVDAMIQIYIDNSFNLASGSSLDDLLLPFGITRIEATSAICKVEFYDQNNNLMDVPIGTQFMTKDGNQTIFTTTTQLKLNDTPITGTYYATTTTTGTTGNTYIGECSLINFITDVARVVIVEITTEARDEETDTELKERLVETSSNKGWGGNIQGYKNWITDGSIDGIGQMQVYPIWNGHGTVKLSMVDVYNVPLTTTKINELYDIICPLRNGTRTYGNGIAPIDAEITIDTPTYDVVNIEMSVTVGAGYTIETIKNNVSSTLLEYVNELNATWGDGIEPYSMNMQIATIGAKCLKISGVDDIQVSSIKINNLNQNHIVSSTATNQYLLQLGTITVNQV
jgi:uncharacterized phage protein gp47/JayE